MDKSAKKNIMKNMDSGHFYFSPKIKPIIDSFSSLLNVKITFYSSNMDEWLTGYHTGKSDFCTMLQKELSSRVRCMQQDDQMCRKCKLNKKSYVYNCYAGLTEIVIPVFVDEDNLLYAFVGQFRTKENLNENIKEELRKKNLDVNEFEKAFLDRPYFSQKQVDNMLLIFQRFCEYIIKTEDLKVKASSLCESIMLYIKDNLSKPVSISDVATFINKSESTITHVLKKETGLSFKEYLIECRINEFEKIVINNPDIAINEASRLVGYDESLYFSRLYKKKRGNPPSAFVRYAKEIYKKSGALHYSI